MSAKPNTHEDVGTEPTAGANSVSSRLSGWGLFAAFVVLVAFGAFVLYMFTQVGAAEVQWTRLAWLFASVEAIAFGAAGALFGSSIQRQRAERAEQEATQNAGTAANGRALAASLVAEADAMFPKPGTPLEAAVRAADMNVASIVIKHAALAQALFH